MKFTDRVTIKGFLKFTTRDARSGKILSVIEKTNLITTNGRNVLARLLAGNSLYTGEVTRGALGSSSTAPSNADTQLGSEIVNARVATTSQTFNDNIAYLSFFFPAPASTINYTEFGTFIDGTATINSGVLFTHVLLSGTISTTQTLTVDVTYTIT